MADIIQFVPSSRPSRWSGDLANVDWRWRGLYNVVHVGYLDDSRAAMIAAKRLLSAKMYTDKKFYEVIGSTKL